MKRLRDEEVDVRLGVLSRLFEISSDSVDNLSVGTYKEIGKRLSDKKLEVRKLAVVGLSRLYFQHVSSRLPSLSSLSRNDNDDIESDGNENGNSRNNKKNNNNKYKSYGTDNNSQENSQESLKEYSQENNLSDETSLMLFSGTLKQGVLLKLGFVPGYVVNSWGYVEMRQLIVQLLQENILPK